MTTSDHLDTLAVIEALHERVVKLEANYNLEEKEILKRIEDYKILLRIYRATPGQEQLITLTERAILRLRRRLGHRSG